jgi:hypothetical protein
MFPPHASPSLAPLTSIDPSVNDGNPANRRNTQHVRSGPGPSLTSPSFSQHLRTRRWPTITNTVDVRILSLLPTSYSPTTFISVCVVHFGLGIQDCSQRKQHHSAIYPSTQYPERSSGAVIAPVVYGNRKVRRILSTDAAGEHSKTKGNRINGERHKQLPRIARHFVRERLINGEKKRMIPSLIDCGAVTAQRSLTKSFPPCFLCPWTVRCETTQSQD